MITLRKRLAGPRARHMLFPAVLFLLIAATSVAAGEAARMFSAPDVDVTDSAMSAVELELPGRDGI
jgi:hypothetical protein